MCRITTYARSCERPSENPASSTCTNMVLPHIYLPKQPAIAVNLQTACVAYATHPTIILRRVCRQSDARAPYFRKDANRSLQS
ncbi:hypothetical protein [Kingella potus]|uniref:hypothetical protein n=1 Tax=Kingella potus TaxID=265175 RepID=UPI001FD0AA1F|nr:hypothetical protein [Kingella potus]UOP01338.1 hypothetical protein LVJ84_03575 [Kingella potus]